MARVLALHRSGVRRVRCVYRPWKLRDEHSGGASFGYRLLWVVVLANLMAMLFQGLSAKLGIATGKERCRTLSRARARAARLCNVDRQRTWGDGDRPRRVSRRDRRSLLSLSHSDADRRRDYSGHYVRHTRAPPLRLPSDGSAHRLFISVVAVCYIVETL